jgi:hypothetical protein
MISLCNCVNQNAIYTVNEVVGYRAFIIYICVYDESMRDDGKNAMPPFFIGT